MAAHIQPVPSLGIRAAVKPLFRKKKNPYFFIIVDD
jgi:hypothetical protein